jgi:hypothetical protein
MMHLGDTQKISLRLNETRPCGDKCFGAAVLGSTPSSKGIVMGLKICAAGFCAVVIAVTTLAVPSAEAQTRSKTQKYVYVTRADGTVVRRPARTRVTVTQRSFLDAGTEVQPGERKFTDYAFPPGYSAFDILVNNTAGFHRSPLLDRWDLPARNSPYGW